MDLLLIKAVSILLAACLVAILAMRLRFPFTVGLVVTGIGLSAFGISAGIRLTHDLIFVLILPPLLFEAALCIHWPEFRKDMLPVSVLASAGVAISTLVVAAGMMWFLAWPAASALIFGALIAATDPVAVIALFRENRVAGRVRLLIESESLLNDGVAAVLLGLIVAWSQGVAATPFAAVTQLCATVAGGIAIGIVCGGGILILARGTGDHLVETVLTTVAAYGSFLVADHAGVSGVFATLAAGMLMGQTNNGAGIGGNKARRIVASSIVSTAGHEFLMSFWEFVAFIANSVTFLLIGLTVPIHNFELFGGVSLSIVIFLVLAGRATAVYGISLMFSRSRWVIPMTEQHVLWWGGLRGALGLALALSLPPTIDDRSEIVTATFAIVVFSLIVQGISMPALLKFLRIISVDKGD